MLASEQLHSSLLLRDARLAGFGAAALVEVGKNVVEEDDRRFADHLLSQPSLGEAQSERDGALLAFRIRDAIPLSTVYKRSLFTKFTTVIRAGDEKVNCHGQPDHGRTDGRQ